MNASEGQRAGLMYLNLWMEQVGHAGPIALPRGAQKIAHDIFAIAY